MLTRGANWILNVFPRCFMCAGQTMGLVYHDLIMEMIQSTDKGRFQPRMAPVLPLMLTSSNFPSFHG